MSSAESVEYTLNARDEWGCIEARLPLARQAANASDARLESGSPLGPLDGVPFAVKANLDVAGITTTAGTTVARAAAARDAEVVASLRAAGAIPVLTTTLAEAAIGSVTVNPWTGPCVSPRDTSRNAGGSSGGSAAAVAAGLVPFALGTDTMGSVRIPAACCGIAGWKPTRGAISTQGLVPLSGALDTVGVLAPSAIDLLPIARVLLGEKVTARPSRIGIASLTTDADEAARAAVDEAANRLRSSGCEVVDVHVDIDAALVRRRGLLLCETEAAGFWGPAVDGDPSGLSDPVRALLRFGRDAPAEAITAAELLRADVERTVRSVLDDVDVILLPTLPGPPPARDEDPAGLADLTAFANLAGVPVVSVPIGMAAEGESVARSVQLIGRYGSDIALIELTAELQA